MNTKIAIIGAGNVGTHIVNSAMNKNLPANFYLVDKNEELEKAHVLDLKDALLFAPKTKIFGTNFGSKELASCDIFVITAGAKQKPDEDRCSLLSRNIQILQSIKEGIGKIKKEALVIIVSNPVDILTYCAQKIFNLPRSQVFGTGTYLDSARLRWRLSEFFNTSIEDISGLVLGEHGDSEFVAWSTVQNASLIREKNKKKIEEETMKEAYEIIKHKGSTYFGIGMVTAEILENIISDSKRVLPLSCCMQGEFNIENVALGVPCKVGREGIVEVEEIMLSQSEYKNLTYSAEKLKKFYKECPYSPKK